MSMNADLPSAVPEMTPEQQAAWAHEIELRKGCYANNIRGLSIAARRLETAQRIGAYNEIDLPVLAEFVCLAQHLLNRANFFIDVDKVVEYEKATKEKERRSV